MKTKGNISPLRISSVFGPKLDEDEKKLDEAQKKKKRRSSPRFCPFRVLKLSAQVTKGGGSMPQFCILFYANYTVLTTLRGGHGTMPP